MAWYQTNIGGGVNGVTIYRKTYDRAMGQSSVTCNAPTGYVFLGFYYIFSGQTDIFTGFFATKNGASSSLYGSDKVVCNYTGQLNHGGSVSLLLVTEEDYARFTFQTLT